MYRPPQNTNIVKSIKIKFESIENNNNHQKSNANKNGYNLNLSDSPKIKKTTTENTQTGNQIIQRQISDQGKRNIKRTPAFRMDRSLERANGFQRHCYNRSTLFECKVKQFSAVKSNCGSNCNFMNNPISDKQPLLGTEETRKVNNFNSIKKPVLIKSKSSLDFQYIRNKFDGNSVNDKCEGIQKDENCIDFENTENINNCDVSSLYTEPVPKALRNKNINKLETLRNVQPESQVNNVHSVNNIRHCDKPPANAVITESLTDTLKTALKRPLPIGPAPRKPPRTFKSLNTDTDEDTSNTLEKNLSFLHVSKQPDERLYHNPKTTVKRADPKYMLSKLENALRNNKLRTRKQARVDISTTSGEDSDDSLLFRSKSNRTLPRLPCQETDDNNAPAFNFNCLNGLRFAMTNYEKIKEPNSCFFVGSPQEEPVYAEPFHYQKDSLDSVIGKREGSTRSKQSARNSLYYMVSNIPIFILCQLGNPNNNNNNNFYFFNLKVHI